MNILKLCRWLIIWRMFEKKCSERNAGVLYKINVQKVNKCIKHPEAGP